MNRNLIAAIGLATSFAIGSGACAQPPPDPMKFDLICKLRDRIVADPDPHHFGDPPWSASDDRFVARFAVDLRAMRVCDVTECLSVGVDPIKSVTARSIVFAWRPHFHWTYDRRSGRTAMRLVTLREVDVTTGPCRKAKFSGFPPGSRFR